MHLAALFLIVQLCLNLGKVLQEMMRRVVIDDIDYAPVVVDWWRGENPQPFRLDQCRIGLEGILSVHSGPCSIRRSLR
jgi:hypothetical protein